MRKAQKQQAIELVKQIEEAHNQIKQYIEQGNIQPAMELLEDCQNGGITIGTLIEETEGEGHPTISLLEDYCELIYQIHKDLTDNKQINANKVYKLLKQKLVKAENSLKNNIIVKKEVVFLPYKASMWDSLESVWKAADADPNCNAYVIPIPYYDKNPDGSFREMHYEGDQYPKDIPITNYKEYDFEVHRPDTIYIHNPYDSLNLVTSVDPFFFSKNLKKYTDELVYIPYFVLDEIKPDEDDKIEGMKHFCTTPGVFNADKVIVQSENMKQVYIKVLLDATNDHSEAARKYWNNKILGLGSPKIDKVLNTKKEDLEIPQEWLKVIEKPDGSWKKIVFYNTGISAILSYGEQILRKMEYIFQLIGSYRDSLAFLWRPHPLIETTLKAMRPELYTKYIYIKERYINDNIGIYDETSELNRAVAISDAFFGDASSVTHLFDRMEKPSMIQHFEIREFDYKCVIFGKNILFDKEDIWIPSAPCNVLFRVNLKEFTSESKGVIGDCKKQIGWMYTDLIKVENRIYFSPCNARTIAIFNLDDNSFEYINLNDLDLQAGENENNYSHCVFSDGYIFFIGACKTNKIMLLELNSRKIELIKLDIDKNNISGALFGYNTVCVREKIYIPLLQMKALYIFDTKSKTGKITYLDDDVCGLRTINYYNNLFFITTNDNKLIIWNKDIKEKIDLPVSYPVYCSLAIDNILFLFPCDSSEYVLKIDCKNCKVIEKFIIPDLVYSACCQTGMTNERHIFLNTRKGIVELFDNLTYKYHTPCIEGRVPDYDDLLRWNRDTVLEHHKIEGVPEYNTVKMWFDEIISDK